MVGLLIPAVDDYTIEQRKPDTQQGTTPQPRPADGVRCAKLRLPRTGRRLRGWRTALISTGTACRAPSAGRRLRGWRTARIRVRARHIVPHQPDAVCGDGIRRTASGGDGGPPGSEFAGTDRPDQSTGTACRQPDAVCGDGRPSGMPCPISRTPFAGMADRPDQSTGTACRAPSAGRRLRGWRTARIRVRARHAVPHQPDAVCGDGRTDRARRGWRTARIRVRARHLQDQSSTGTACRAPSAGRRLRGWRTARIRVRARHVRAPSAGRRLRGWRTARIRVRARHAVPHQPDAVCGDGGPPGSEYGHGISCPISRTPFAGMADRPDQSTGTACRAS
jgi:hypothetical protein